MERGAASRIEKKNGVVKREDPRGGGPLENPLVDRQFRRARLKTKVNVDGAEGTGSKWFCLVKN